MVADGLSASGSGVAHPARVSARAFKASRHKTGIKRCTPAAHLLLRGSPIILLCLLAACGGGVEQRPSAGSYSYAPPGPPEDPWGPYIKEAAQRFSVPERWIRAVMHQESGGHEYLRGQPITSDAGATGLMQVMPATYAELRAQYNLGDDPYSPHDNIMAGTAYIREMYDRYGSPAFLAAYNAGPMRVEQYLAGRGALPNETVNYLASIAPHLGTEVAMTGPLAVFGAGGVAGPDPVPRSYASAPLSKCWRDPDAAYDPDAPCRSAPPMRVARAAPVAPRVAVAQAACWHDPDAAYDPSAPCQTPPRAPVEIAMAAPNPQPAPRHMDASCWHDPDAAYDPAAPCQPRPTPASPAAPRVQLAEAALPTPTPYTGPTNAGRVLWGNAPAQRAPSTTLASASAPAEAPVPRRRSLANYLIPQASAAELPPSHLHGAWSIQVGAFSSADLARGAAADARAMVPRSLSLSHTVIGATSPFGGHVLYRARLAGLSAQDAQAACSLLAAQRQACATVPPGG